MFVFLLNLRLFTPGKISGQIILGQIMKEHRGVPL